LSPGGKVLKKSELSNFAKGLDPIFIEIEGAKLGKEFRIENIEFIATNFQRPKRSKGLFGL
jgi:hypothetical protein